MVADLTEELLRAQQKLADPAKSPNAYLAEEVEAVLRGNSRRNMCGQTIIFLGPAMIACVAYIDPGNFATNIQAGSEFGYALVWVVVTSNLIGMLLQSLSAKLGIATGLNLAELCRERFHFSVTISLWVLMEIVAMATDLAEFLGAALGFHLLSGMAMWQAGLITAALTFGLLSLQQFGARPVELIITLFVLLVTSCYIVEIFLGEPDWRELGYHAVVPSLPGPGASVLAAGILGATVMPHAIFLHSSLTQDRLGRFDCGELLRRLHRYTLLDVVLSMGLAGLVNVSMLSMAAATFFANDRKDVTTIEDAFVTLQPLLGDSAKFAFGLALLASGLSSSFVGTMAGDVMMQGFVRCRIPAWLRRSITMAPSLIVIFLGMDPTTVLVWSQVVLSLALPAAVIPLACFTADRDLMGPLTNSLATSVVTWICITLILSLNIYLLYDLFQGG